MGNSVDHVLHIGAGLCAQLPEYRAAGAKAITLFEPDAQTAAVLRTQTADIPEVLVVETAVSTSAKPQQLHRFSFADLNSLRAPTGLNALFPALEILGKDAVQVQNPVDLVRGLQLSETGAHMLVLEAPGEAFSILEALDEAGLLSQFRYLRISEAREVLYEGATRLLDIRTWLAAHHFTIKSKWDNADPERPVLSVTYDELGAAQAHAQAQIETLEQALAAKIKDQEALQQTVADLTADRDHWKSGHGTISKQLSDMSKAGERQSDAQARSQHQLALSREELLKAQGQITLISDLLLRGSTL